MKTSDLTSAAQAALEALESLQGGCTDHNDGTVEAITVWCPEVIDALRAALAQPTQPQGEPVAWICRTGHGTGLRAEKPTGDVMPFWTPLYTRQPAPTQQPYYLSDYPGGRTAVCETATGKIVQWVPLPLTDDRVERLKDAIEGECDGLAITDAHALAILQYVDGIGAGEPT